MKLETAVQISTPLLTGCGNYLNVKKYLYTATALSDCSISTLQIITS